MCIRKQVHRSFAAFRMTFFNYLGNGGANPLARAGTAMQREDRLLEGAIDIHAHGYPEFTLNMPPRVDNVEWAKLASAARMRGFVIKSHLWPTAGAAHLLRGLYPDLEIFGSITLNPPAGGLSPFAVEVAAQTGAKVVWMPTWSARHDPPKHSIYLTRMQGWLKTLDASLTEFGGGVRLLGEDGKLLPVVLQILDVCKTYDLVVASGHVPVQASLLLSQETKKRGVKFVFTHPLSGSVGASLEDQAAVVANGGVIEHVFIGCMPMHQRADPKKIVESIRAVGPENCVMASDAIEAWNPPAPEVLRMFIASMLALGLKEDEIFQMTHDNPARLLGLAVKRQAVAGVPGE